MSNDKTTQPAQAVPPEWANAVEWARKLPLTGTYPLRSRDILAVAAMLVAAPQPKGYKLLKDSTLDERTWHEDESHENGRYCCTCCECGRMFIGHKRRVVCKVCAAPSGQGEPDRIYAHTKPGELGEEIVTVGLDRRGVVRPDGC